MESTPASTSATGRRRVAVLAVSGVATCVLIAVATYPSSDLRLAVLIFASAWFVGPLAFAASTGNETLAEDLVSARGEPLTMLLLKLIGRVLIGVAALFAGLWGFAIALVAVLLVAQARGGLSPESDESSLAVALLLAVAALAWMGYPFAVGFRRGVDERETRQGAIRVLGGLAGVICWGGRSVTGMAIRLRENTLWGLFLLVTIPLGLIFGFGVYAVQPVLAKSSAFDQFGQWGLDKEEMAVGTAAALVAAIDILAWLRARARTAQSAILVVLFSFTMSVLALRFATHELTAHESVWRAGPSVLAGVAYGVSLAALLDLAQAITAGMAGMQRCSAPPVYGEFGRWAKAICAHGQSAATWTRRRPGSRP